MTFCHTIIYPLLCRIITGRQNMPNPTSMVSIRITDDELALVDQRVGLDGTRNRSDVIRVALRAHLESQPDLPGMESVSIKLGTARRKQLGSLYHLTGSSTEEIIHIALSEYISKIKKELLEDTEDLEMLAGKYASETQPRDEYSE